MELEHDAFPRTRVCVISEGEIIEPDEVPSYPSLHCTIDFHGRSFQRSLLFQSYPGSNFREWLLAKIESVQDDFYLQEGELLEEVVDLLTGDFRWMHFKRQVRIDGCIADGLAFVGEKYGHSAKIIGFEVKSNHDNYTRLYNQVNAYLAICDEVYLVIQDKAPPAELPFYVGVIRIENGKGVIERKATNLKHSISAGELWDSLLIAFGDHMGLTGTKDILRFFNTVETIKRKLIFNQQVVGQRQSYVQTYIPLTEMEKNIVRAGFNKSLVPTLDMFSQHPIEELKD